MRKLIVGLVSASALATVGMAAAANGTVASDQTFSNSAAGIYVGGGLGWGYLDVTKDPADTNFSNNAIAWDALVGYQFNSYVALEAAYIDFGRAKETDAIYGNVSMKVSGFGVDVKGIYPVNSQLDLFGTAGMMYMTSRGSDNTGADKTHDWTPDLGAGVAYKVTKNVALTVQDVYAFENTGKSPAANAVLAGVNYKFDI